MGVTDRTDQYIDESEVQKYIIKNIIETKMSIFDIYPFLYFSFIFISIIFNFSSCYFTVPKMLYSNIILKIYFK